jgi:hypothetical protein
MEGWRPRAALFAAALWWGSLTAIGFIAVPLLFAYLPNASLAGQTAARLFTAQTWTTIGCGLLILLASRSRGDGPHGMPASMLFVLGGMLLALLAEFAIAPRIVARENLRVWHGVGSAMYLLQWVCAGATLWNVSSTRTLSSRA